MTTTNDRAHKPGSLIVMVGLFVLSLAVYSLVISWKFAVVLMVSLLWHEYGHVWCAKRYGMRIKGIYFVPFVGGAAVPSDRMPSRDADVVISLMGPIFGLVLALMTAGAYAVSGWTLLAVAVAYMALLNLFNLIPICPLDGGRVLHCIACSTHPVVGTVLMGLSAFGAMILFLVGGHPLILLVGFFSMCELMDYMKRPKRRRMYAYFMEARKRILDGTLPMTWRVHLAHAFFGLFEDFPPSECAPSAEEILSRIEAEEPNLREPPPLSPRWIVASAYGWLLVVGAFGVLGSLMILVPGVLELFLNPGAW